MKFELKMFSLPGVIFRISKDHILIIFKKAILSGYSAHSTRICSIMEEYMQKQ